MAPRKRKSKSFFVNAFLEPVPVDGPPVDEPPVDEPPVDEPPVDEPPVDEPPVDEPPVDEPPVDEYYKPVTYAASEPQEPQPVQEPLAEISYDAIPYEEPDAQEPDYPAQSEDPPVQELDYHWHIQNPPVEVSYESVPPGHISPEYPPSNAVSMIVERKDGIYAEKPTVLNGPESPLTCIYFTPIVEVLVGPDQSVFVHKGILSESPVLEAKCNSALEAKYSNPFSNDAKFTVSEVDLDVFALVVTYLYTGDYTKSPSPREPARWATYSDMEKLHKHIQLYSFSKNYKLERLSELTVRSIEDSSEPEFQSLLKIATEVYETLPEDDVWFSEHFKTATRQRFKEDPDLPDQPWILEAIRRGGKLAVDLFAALTSVTDKAVVRTQGPTADLPSQIGTSTCANKAEHLARLGKKGLWTSCEACKRDRSRMLALGSTIITLALGEHDFNLNSVIGVGDQAESSSNIVGDVKGGKKAKKEKKKKLRKQVRAASQQPHVQLLASILFESSPEEDWTGFCPRQKYHLKKAGDKWLWEDCPRCIQDRTRLLEKVSQLQSPTEVRDQESNGGAASPVGSDYSRQTTETDLSPTLEITREVDTRSERSFLSRSASLSEVGSASITTEERRLESSLGSARS